MADIAAAKRLVLDVSRTYQMQLHPSALNSLVTFARNVVDVNAITSSASAGDSREVIARERELALQNLFACLAEVVAGDSKSSSSSISSSSRHVNAESVSAAVHRYQTISGVKLPAAAAALAAGEGTAAAKSNNPAAAAAGGARANNNATSSTSTNNALSAGFGANNTNITDRLQVIPTHQIPFGLVDPHSGGVSIHPLGANAAAQSTGVFQRADRQFALTQRYLSALGRCHRSGLYRKGITAMGVGSVDDRRPALVPISSLEGLPDHIETALMGILQFASLADGSGSGTATQNLGIKGSLDSTAVGWRLEDPRATIPLIFPPGFDSELSLVSQHGIQRENNNDDPSSNSDDTHNANRYDRPTHRIGFLLKGSCVVALGKWTPDGYLVKRLELPPGEARDVTIGAQHGIDTFGLAPHDPVRAKATEAAATDDVIIFIARVHLDKTSVHYNLSKLFGALKDKTDAELASMTFVFVGDFSSKAVASGDVSHFTETATPMDAATAANAAKNAPLNSNSAINDPNSPFINGREGFAALFDQLGATVSAAAANVAAHARFVFIPGPRDLSLLRGFIPQPPIPIAAVLGGFMRKCPHVTSASNPCRLRFLTKEIVVAQSDFYQSLRAEAFHLNTCVNSKKHKSNAMHTTASGSGGGGGSAGDFHTALHAAAAQQQHLKKLNAIHIDDDDDDNANGAKAQKEQPFEHVVKTIIDHAHLFPAVPSSAASVLSTNTFVQQQQQQSAQHASNSIGLTPGGGAASPSVMLAAAKTASSSSSLVMQKNIVWNQDHCLKLSPLPHFLLLCDQTQEWTCTYKGCRVLNPGCFSSTASFVWFTPSDGELTFNTI